MSNHQLAFYRPLGHLTLNRVFAAELMLEAIADIEQWGEQVLSDLPVEQPALPYDHALVMRVS